MVSVSLLLSLASPSVHACTVSALSPINGTTLTTKTNFTFQVTTDCTTTSFSVAGIAGTRTPTYVGMVGGKKLMQVTTTDADWTSWTRSTKATIVWTATAADAAAVSNSKSATNQLDLDADSWTRTAGDTGTCDAAATINPGVVETCDGIDNDCDASTDEGVTTTFYRDADSDGHGAIGGATNTACSAPSGYVAAADDCDDTLPAVYIGAPESCNGIDDDCDSTVDEAGASGSVLYFADADTDGYGDVAATAFVCAQPAGYVTDSSDCDDSDMDIHPDAVEICNGVDDDCDALADVDDPGVADAISTYVDADLDGYGDGLPFAVCGDPGSGFTTVGGDCDDTAAAVWPGAPEYCDALDNDCDGTTDEAGVVDGTAYYEDLDADGYGETASGVVTCAAPGPGWVTLSGDCDDADEVRNPGLAEYCDGMDNDCNELVTDGGLVSIASVNYATINDAVAAADTGATVNVCAGTWRESISVTDDIVLNAPQGPELTILDGGGRRQILRATGTTYDPSGSIEVYGFTFRRGYASCSGCTGYGGAVDAGGASLLVVENSRFERNVAGYAAGAIRLPLAAGAWTEIADSQFSRNRAPSGGALFGSGGEGGVDRELHIATSTFSDNVASSEGGVLYDYAASAEQGGLSVLVEGSSFSGNRGGYGGVFRLWYGALDLNDSTISDNYAGSAGAVLHTGASAITFNRSTFTDNYANAYGGVLHCNESPCDATLTESTFTNNSAGSYGGVYYTSASGTLTLTSNLFAENMVYGGYGGVFSLAPTTLSTSGNTFRGNGASGDGGAFYYYQYEVPLTWTSSADAFEDNYSWSGSGGAISANYLSADFDDTVFTGNEAAGAGGALYAFGSYAGAGSATFSGAQFIDNHAAGDGGALRVLDGWGVDTTLALEGVYADGNSAGGSGGVVSQSYGTLNLSNTELLDNVAQSNGGAIAIGSAILNADATSLLQGGAATYGQGGCLYASSSTVVGIVCDQGSALSGYGGGIYATSSVLNDVAVTNSGAIYGGGMRLDFSTLTGGSASGNSATYEGGGASLYNTSVMDLEVSGNHAGGAGGGLYAYSWESDTLVNVDATGNSAVGSGGGAYVHGVGWSGGTVSANTAASGGGVYSYSGSLSDLLLTLNTATSGGGLYASGGTADQLAVTDNDATDGAGVYGDSLTATNIMASGNAATGSGGGAWINYGTWTGGTISGNSAINGGGVRQAGSTMSSVTISGNAATTSGGGIYGYGSLLSSLLQSNTAALGGGAYIVDSDSIWQYTNVYNNVGAARGGGAYVTTGRTLYTTTVDPGTGATDNTPGDFYLQYRNFDCRYDTAGTRTFAGSAVRCPT